MKHVALVGLMATGKTTIGALVAGTLGRPLIDSDAQVEATTGRTVRQIWRTDGEDAFRDLEAAALAAALDSPDPAVIAAAGGVVLRAENRARLGRDDVDVVWLRAAPETLLERVRLANDVHRPLLDADPGGMLEQMATDRTALYEEVADHVIDVDGRPLDEIADELLRAIGGEAA
ncbi:MAG: shikimate kinase [Acidimicrobiales bacterium]